MYGFALVCSPTIREYFQVAVKYHRLATPLLSMSWREEGDYVSWIFPMNAAVTYPDSLLRFLVEQQLTQLSTHLRAVVENDSYLPVRAALSYSAPDHTHLYKRLRLPRLGPRFSISTPEAARMAGPREIRRNSGRFVLFWQNVRARSSISRLAAVPI
jgi:hypothetical protein